MSEYSELIEDLLVNGLGYGFQVAGLTQRAAKALEAQAKRIATLEAALKETLAIAERNELGECQLRARAALKGEMK